MTTLLSWLAAGVIPAVIAARLAYRMEFDSRMGGKSISIVVIAASVVLGLGPISLGCGTLALAVYLALPLAVPEYAHARRLKRAESAHARMLEQRREIDAYNRQHGLPKIKWPDLDN